MTLPDDELLENAVRGDTVSMRTLLERHGAQVKSRIGRKIARQWRPVLDADDVMQVAYLEAFLQIDQLTTRDPASFIAWLTRIAENNLRDAIKALERPKRPHPARRIQMPADDDSYIEFLELMGCTTTTPSRQAARHEAKAIVDSALSQLPDDYRRAVRLYDLEGRSGPEVAASMGRSVGAIHMLRGRAHDRLRDLLGSSSKFFSDGTRPPLVTIPSNPRGSRHERAPQQRG